MQHPTEKSLDNYRINFHKLLRLSALYSEPKHRRLLLTLIDNYYQEERNEPLLNINSMTEGDKTSIREFFIMAMCWLFDEAQWIGDSNIRQLITAYKLFRTEIYPIAKELIGHSLGKYHRGMFLMAELRLRYWAFGPNLGKVSGSFTFGGANHEWWQKSKDITLEMHDESIKCTKSELMRISQEYTLND